VKFSKTHRQLQILNLSNFGGLEKRLSFRPQGEILYPSDSKISQSCLLRNDKVRELSFRSRFIGREVLECRKDFSVVPPSKWQGTRTVISIPIHRERNLLSRWHRKDISPPGADRYDNGMIRNDKKLGIVISNEERNLHIWRKA